VVLKMIENVFKTIVSVMGATLSFIFGSWSTLFGILLTVVVLDYITGIISAWINGKLSSDHGRKGIIKKVYIFAIVAVGHMIDLLLGNEPFIRDVTTFFYITNELISILENTGRAGIPLPKKLKKAIEILKE